LLAFKSTPVEPVDENDEVSTGNVKTTVVTLALKFRKVFLVSDMTNEDQGANPFDLLDTELSECHKQAEAAVSRTREFRDELCIPRDAAKIRRNNSPVRTDSNTKDSGRIFCDNDELISRNNTGPFEVDTTDINVEPEDVFAKMLDSESQYELLARLLPKRIAPL